MDLNLNEQPQLFGLGELLNFGNGYSVESLLTGGNNEHKKKETTPPTILTKHDKVSDIFKNKAVPASLYFNTLFKVSAKEENNNNNNNNQQDSDVLPDDLYEKLFNLSINKKKIIKKKTRRMKEVANKKNINNVSGKTNKKTKKNKI
jgi:hypothetical protein